MNTTYKFEMIPNYAEEAILSITQAKNYDALQLAMDYYRYKEIGTRVRFDWHGCDEDSDRSSTYMLYIYEASKPIDIIKLKVRVYSRTSSMISRKIEWL